MIDGCATCSARASWRKPLPRRLVAIASRCAGCGWPPDGRARGARRDGPCCRDGRGRAARRSRRCRAVHRRPARRRRRGSRPAPPSRGRTTPCPASGLREPSRGRAPPPRPATPAARDRPRSAPAPASTGAPTRPPSDRIPSNGSRPVTSSNSSDAERIHVRSGVDDAAGELLGRRVSHRAEELLRAGEPRLVAALPHRRHAEVDDLVDPVAAAEVVRDDVGRLQVAVNDAARMRQRQRRADRRHDPLHVLAAGSRPRCASSSFRLGPLSSSITRNGRCGSSAL